MARWKLICAHHIYTDPPTEWMYQEIDRSTGRQKQKKHVVPRYLNPLEQSDWTENYRDATGAIVDGITVVCHVGKGHPSDIQFLGEPTPDMDPLDDEAREISKSLEAKHRRPAEAIPGETYSQSLLAHLEMTVAARKEEPQNYAALQKLMEQLVEIQSQNQKLMQAMSERALERRV